MIYLASTSARRKKILRDLKIAFRCVVPDYEETRRVGEGPKALVRRHALGKALSAVPLIRDGVILSADTVVYFRGKILGKPRDLRHARLMLGRLQNREHRVYTGVCALKVIGGKGRDRHLHVEMTKIRLKAMNRGQIVSYFRKVNPLDKAGSYAIQSRSVNLVEWVRGSRTNAMGLPVEFLKQFVGRQERVGSERIRPINI